MVAAILSVLFLTSALYAAPPLPELALKEGSLDVYGHGCMLTRYAQIKVSNLPSHVSEHTKLKFAVRDKTTKPILAIVYNRLPEKERTNLVVRQCYLSFSVINRQKTPFSLSFAEHLNDYYYEIEQTAEPLYRSTYGFSLYIAGQKKHRGFADLNVTKSDDGRPRRGSVTVKLGREMVTPCQSEFHVVLKFTLIQRALRFLPPEDDPDMPRPNAKLEFSRLGDLQGVARSDTCA